MDVRARYVRAKRFVLQDLEGLTKVFGWMSTGTSRRKLTLWADFLLLSFNIDGADLRVEAVSLQNSAHLCEHLCVLYVAIPPAPYPKQRFRQKQYITLEGDFLP